jgi:hypothetical protein
MDTPKAFCYEDSLIIDRLKAEINRLRTENKHLVAWGSNYKHEKITELAEKDAEIWNLREALKAIQETYRNNPDNEFDTNDIAEIALSGSGKFTST